MNGQIKDNFLDKKTKSSLANHPPLSYRRQVGRVVQSGYKAVRTGGVKAGKRLQYWALPHADNDYRPYTLRHKTLVAYSAALIAVKIAVLSLLLITYPSPAEFSTITVNRIIELTNKERQKRGLSILKHNSTLDLAAQKKAEDMFKYDYFAHTSPAGVKPWYWFKQVNYNYTYAGENLAMNFVQAEDVVQAWMNSPSHRDNILSKNYNDIGIAVKVGVLEGHKTALVVQLFGKSYTNVAGETFAATSPPIEGEQLAGPINLTEQAVKKEVKLESKKSSGWVAKLIYYSEKFFLVFLGFIILNLILTIIIRIEIQHKPIIMHCLAVILLALIMIFFRPHFIEQIGQVINII